MVFNLNRFPSASNRFKLVENLISSGYLDKVKPKFILLENAGRNDLNILKNEVTIGDRITYDSQSLNLWLRYGEKIEDIIHGLNPNITQILLESDTSIKSYNRSSIGNCNGEIALVEKLLPISDNNSINAEFKHILVPNNATLLTKVGFDHAEGDLNCSDENRS